MAGSDGQMGNAIALPTATDELGLIINSNQTNQFTPGDTEEASCVRWKTDRVDSFPYWRRKARTQPCSMPDVEPGAPGLHHLCSYTKWNPSPTTADLPCASLAAGFHLLDHFGSVLAQDLSWIPCYSITASLCCLHHRTLHKVFYFSYLEMTYSGEPREERETDGPKSSLALTGWCEDGFAQTGASHFCGQCRGFSCPWEGEGRSNTPSTDQTLWGTEGIFACFPDILNHCQVYRTTGTKSAESEEKEKREKGRKTSQNDQWELQTMTSSNELEGKIDVKNDTATLT